MRFIHKLLKLIGKPFTISEDQRLRLLALSARGDVLDIGFVQQPNMYLTKNKHVKRITGADIQETKLPKGYSAFVKIDIDKPFPIPNKSFDTVIAGEVIEHCWRHVEFISEVARVLKVRGHFILSTPNAYTPLWIINNLSAKSVIYRTPRKTYELDHVHLFGQKILQMIFYSYGFRLDSITSGLLRENLVCDFVLETKKLHIVSPYKKGGSRHHDKGEASGPLNM